jgi:hypothetical protein
MLIAAGVTEGAGKFLGAHVQAQSLEGKAKIAESEAQLADIQAEDEREIGAQQTAQGIQAASAAVAASVSSTAGAGIDIGGATAQEVILSTELAGVEDVIQIGRNARKRVWGKQTEAAQLRVQAGQLKKAARQTRQFALLPAAAPIVSGVSQARTARSR